MTDPINAPNSFWQDLHHTEHRLSFVDIQGVRTRILVAGNGPVLLLLHGTGGHLETYQKNVSSLAEHFTVVVPDMVGHGYSDRPEIDYSLDDFADHLFNLLDYLAADTAYISGESLGGGVACWMALKQPGRVLGLALNTGILERPDEEGLKQLDDLEERTKRLSNELTLESVRRRLEWLVLDPASMTDEMVRIRFEIYSQPQMVEDVQRVMSSVLQMNRGLYRGVDYYDRERLRQIKCPTLVLWSDHNPGKPYERVAAAIATIPDVEVHMIESAAHWPQFEQPATVNKYLVDFLTRQR